VVAVRPRCVRIDVAAGDGHIVLELNGAAEFAHRRANA
jgi:hypothetical protein